MITLIKDDMHMPHYRRERVPDKIPQYKLDVMNGEDHPLQGKDFIYKLTHIDTLYQDAMGIAINGYPASREGTLTSDEVEFLRTACKQSQLDWAIENSFDGLYIKKQLDPASYRMVYALYVYMEEQQATFWRLKYGSR